MSVEPLLPVAVPRSAARFARGVRAGNWLFATGLSGTDFVNGLAPEMVRAAHPLNGPPQAKREAQRLFRNLQEVLAAGGAGLADIVRLDQYYTVFASVLSGDMPAVDAIQEGDVMRQFLSVRCRMGP